MITASDLVTYEDLEQWGLSPAEIQAAAEAAIVRLVRLGDNIHAPLTGDEWDALDVAIDAYDDMRDEAIERQGK